jgi:hypothetical protein
MYFAYILIYYIYMCIYIYNIYTYMIIYIYYTRKHNVNPIYIIVFEWNASGL